MLTFFQAIFAPPRHLILLLIALWPGLVLSEKLARRYGISTDAINNIIYYSMLGYILGGRLFFVLANLSTFAQSPLSVFSVNVDLFDPLGAFVATILVGAVYGRNQKLSMWSTLDVLTPLFATLAIGVSLSHLAAGTAFGKTTELPWGIELWNATRHPSQIYELVASLFIFGILWLRNTVLPAGSSFLLFIAATAAARLFLESFRGDSTIIFGSLRQAQVIAWIVLAMALFASEAIRSKAELH